MTRSRGSLPRKRSGELRAVLAGIALSGVTACGEARQFHADRTFTSTVTVSNEGTLAIDAVIPMKVTGDPRADAIYATLHATVTASTSTRAERLARDLTLAVDRKDGRISIGLANPPAASLEGSLEVRVPADLDFEGIERHSSVDVLNMRGTLSLISRSHARVVGAKQSVMVAVGTGNALVDSDLVAGTKVEVSVQHGDIELTVPAAISADITVPLPSQGQVVVNHPQLRPPPTSTGQPYHAVVGGGLSVVTLKSDVGNIVIRTR